MKIMEPGHAYYIRLREPEEYAFITYYLGWTDYPAYYHDKKLMQVVIKDIKRFCREINIYVPAGDLRDFIYVEANRPGRWFGPFYYLFDRLKVTTNVLLLNEHIERSGYSRIFIEPTNPEAATFDTIKHILGQMR